MSKKRPIQDKIRYRMDSLYSSGTGAVIISLGVLSLILVAISTIMLVTYRLAPGKEEPYSLIEAVWVSMLSTIGSGSIGGRGTMWSYRFLMLGMTFGSIFVTSFLISALTNGLVSRVGELKKGRSIVVENGHTVILGWSAQVFRIISELMIAYSGRDGACIVILGNVDKGTMEEQIRQKVKQIGRTRVVCRTGDPMEMADLDIVSINTSRNIIILRPDTSYPDADIIKIVLAIVERPGRRKDPYQVVAGIFNPNYLEIAQVAGKDEVQWLMTADIVSRVIAQTSLQPGLSVVYNDLFDYANNEIYNLEARSLVGHTFAEITTYFSHCSLIGILTNDRKVQLAPGNERVLASGEKLILIARDEKSITFDPFSQVPIQAGSISQQGQESKLANQILILGWNWRGTKIIRELDRYVHPGSEVTILADQEKIDDLLARECKILSNLTVCSYPGDTDDRQILEGMLMNPYDHVIILGYSDKLSTQRADAKTLVTLLHLRDIKERDRLTFTIVTEMMDVRNFELATTARADDYIVSDLLISLLMSQVAEKRERYPVIMDLLNPEGMEIYLKPASLYIQPGTIVNFATLVASAALRSEVAIGYRIEANSRDFAQNYGIVLNPAKTDPIQFSQGDKIVVLAAH